MSTNINTDNLPNLQELEQLANQFFKSAPGGVVNQLPVQQAPEALPLPGAVTDTGLFTSPQQPAASVPSSTIGGGGISPSAINQNNAVNLKDPQTSFADPNLNTHPAPSTPVQNSASAAFGGQLPTQPGVGYDSYLVKTALIPEVPLKQNFQVEQLSPAPESLFQLPYQQEQAFDIDLKKILGEIRTSGPSNGSPFTGAPAAAEVPFYFLSGNYGLPSVKPEPEKVKQVGLSHIIAPPFDVNIVRRDFPILHEQVNGKQLVWLDNAATTQKPRQVIDRISYFYEHENSNIHRAAHELAARATDAYEGARKKVQKFLNARSLNEIIFVRGATEAINLVAKSWGEQYLNAGDEIIVSQLEHHANIVPWQQLAAKKGLKIRIIPVDDDGQILVDEYVKLLGPKTKLVSFTQVSNALGTVTPAAQIVHLAHLAGAKVLVDGAQSVSHMPVDVQALNADWFVFSGHKVFGPTGIGVLYGKEDLLNETQPWQGGGNMIKNVTFEYTQYHDAPGRFEAGTGNIADAVGLGAAIDYVTRLGMPLIAQYEHYLLVYATQLLKDVKGIRLIGTAPDKASVLSFVLDGYKTEEVGAALNQQGIAVRSGHHCAQPILRRFGVEATVRPSLAFYNTCAEIDLLVNTLHSLKR
ncbi:family 2A encapsulin nanocompartment cargo protein cysteine desulfurase [Mucilaginibacter ginsenosidivorax]|uniref:cysteine desulfurase n=1 Tax=Mucilaginibacter ginsenosidivorax TaxID=862126 RepID=A0A5B8VYR7_9SPHI|nr:family 2A encapsulin nanocompartment cargo protein cysteine desulfurase [Mucilaginibacter ginsenosidivorax]QEC76421.1 SufS family cysteine desulfurase [Mucilaginibacter ginsenosidivorax]